MFWIKLSIDKVWLNRTLDYLNIDPNTFTNINDEYIKIFSNHMIDLIEKTISEKSLFIPYNDLSIPITISKVECEVNNDNIKQAPNISKLCYIYKYRDTNFSCNIDILAKEKKIKPELFMCFGDFIKKCNQIIPHLTDTRYLNLHQFEETGKITPISSPIFVTTNDEIICTLYRMKFYLSSHDVIENYCRFQFNYDFILKRNECIIDEHGNIKLNLIFNNNPFTIPFVTDKQGHSYKILSNRKYNINKPITLPNNYNVHTFMPTGINPFLAKGIKHKLTQAFNLHIFVEFIFDVYNIEIK